MKAPTISVPKGGGALKDIGEKFSVNAATGTGAMSIPLATSPGRGGFGPSLALSYDSGSGIGPFGFGWSLGLPTITRKTDKGLPRYLDRLADEEDVFLLSGSEDLVPVVGADDKPVVDLSQAGIEIRRYRPRVEGLFARIERWTELSTREVSWRSISRDNITTWYGTDPQSRIADPYPPPNNGGTPRTFQWLARASWDDKGNAICYEYAAENTEGVNLRAGSERNRTHTANRYLKRVLYGNRKPSRDLDTWYPIDPTGWTRDHWLFEVVFDYDEGHLIDVSIDPQADEKNVHRFSDASPLGEVAWNSVERGWPQRPDPTSVFRAGFEVRTHRRCRRVLMFHHIPDDGDQPGYDGLVRSTEFDYRDLAELGAATVEEELAHHGSTRFGSFLMAVTVSGFNREAEARISPGTGVWAGALAPAAGFRRFLRRDLPPLEFTYSKANLVDKVQVLDRDSLANLPVGLSGSYQLTDLDGVGIPGILTEQAGAWWFKAPLGDGHFAPAVQVPTIPATGALADGNQLVDLAGDGSLDVVNFAGPVAGFYERDTEAAWANIGQGVATRSARRVGGRGGGTGDGGWLPWRPLTHMPTIDWSNPNIKVVDLTGDGHADVLLTDTDAFTWWPSLAEEGFDRARQVAFPVDEERGPRLVFGDGTQQVFLADMDGDGLTDLVRFKGDEIAYWPNLGHGNFGAKVVFDNCPTIELPDLRDNGRLRLIDIDGSGATDIVYLHRDGVRIFYNQAGNRLSDPHTLVSVRPVDGFASLTTGDLLGQGTGCLIWSSPATVGDGAQLNYIDLTGGVKPHLLVRSVNNLGGETEVVYKPSTYFYLQDVRAGRPWVTHLSFPVQVVERVISRDHIARTRFVNRYAYHHGYFDGTEREFRGFGMVEQWDTDTLDALAADGDTAYHTSNIDATNYVPPVHTKTWFHTGAYLDRTAVSNFYAGLYDSDLGDLTGPLGPKDDLKSGELDGGGEYFREPRLNYRGAAKLLLADSQLPEGLTFEEQREACRALKGATLRHEVYADDPPPDSAQGDLDYAPRLERSRTPYLVTEQNLAVKLLQPRGMQRHAVFHTHQLEKLTYHYERNHADPRISHEIVLEADNWGNVQKQVTIAYGRRTTIRNIAANGSVAREANPEWLALAAGNTDDGDRQTPTAVLYTETEYTTPIADAVSHRGPLTAEARTFELTEFTPTGPAGRFVATAFVEPDPRPDRVGRLRLRYEHDVPYHLVADQTRSRRPVQWQRTFYRDDATDLATLPLGKARALALTAETYTLAFTPQLLATILRRKHPVTGDEDVLVTDQVGVLGQRGGDRGGYVAGGLVGGPGLCADIDDISPDPAERATWWWIPSGRSFHHRNPAVGGAAELSEARRHFFVARSYRDPFGYDTTVNFDAFDLLGRSVEDTLGNQVTSVRNDYRVLRPAVVEDPNGNRTAVVYDALGFVTATAVMGKPAPAPAEGDSAAGFVADRTEGELDDFFNDPDPRGRLHGLLGDATGCFISNPTRFCRSQQAHAAATDVDFWQPAASAHITRETHVHGEVPRWGERLQVAFSYSDGHGQEVQQKLQAEPGPLEAGEDSAPAGLDVAPRWVGSGWVVVNNKGLPVRKFEPFFAGTHQFEFKRQEGVSPVVFYDPLGRAVATLHPNGTYEKVRFNSWQQTTFDVNDTCAIVDSNTGAATASDPATDGDIRSLVALYLADKSWEAWYSRSTRVGSQPEQRAAAQQAASHANTPTVAHLETLGRTFLTVAHNRVRLAGHPADGHETFTLDKSKLDIEGNQLEVSDAARGDGAAGYRSVMRYSYDIAGRRLRQESMEAGSKWMLPDVAGNPIRSWDSRGHDIRSTYDGLRRFIEAHVTGLGAEADSRTTTGVVVQRVEYGEALAAADPGGAGEARARRLNVRTRVFRQFDTAGVVVNARGVDDAEVAYDFKGNLLGATRQLLDDPASLPDWAGQPVLQAEVYASASMFDAYNRAVQTVAPHLDQQGARVNVTQQRFNEANMLQGVDVWTGLTNEPAALLDPAGGGAGPQPDKAGVEHIAYNAKGQRVEVAYHNGASTRYTYDPDTFRLVSLETSRGAGFPADGQPPGRFIQNLRYTYDPAGNITRIVNDAQRTIFFNGRVVQPASDYTYDSFYRLIKASGRIHLGQAAAPQPSSYNDVWRVNHPHPHDGQAMGNYTEQYVYDHAGNITTTERDVVGNSALHWTRTFTYEEPSLLEPGKTSNRLTTATVGGKTTRYSTNGDGFDSHGNMLRMEQLQLIQWDFQDRMMISSRQKVNDGDAAGVEHAGETTWYAYDGSGIRIRKATRRPAGSVKERLYLGVFELFTDDRPVDGVTRETLHVMNDKQRVTIVETRTAGVEDTPTHLVRFQHGNHPGSVSFELDDTGGVISLEEFSPYGSTTVQSLNQTLTKSTRYRFTGKERDEESGLYYHGARYYASFLGRWISTDELPREANLYVYCLNNPVVNSDPDGHRPLNETDKAYLAELDSLRSSQQSKWDSLPGWKKVLSVLSPNPSAASNARLARVHAGQYEAAVARAAEGEPIVNAGQYRTDFTNMKGDVVGSLATIASYQTASEARWSEIGSDLSALSSSALASGAYLGASAAGASDKAAKAAMHVAATLSVFAAGVAIGLKARAANNAAAADAPNRNGLVIEGKPSAAEETPAPAPKSGVYIPRDTTGKAISLSKQWVDKSQVGQPNRGIPLPDPRAEGYAHTVLGGKESSSGTGLYRQTATFTQIGNDTKFRGFDASGQRLPQSQPVPFMSVHWGDHGTPQHHANPHVHGYGTVGPGAEPQIWEEPQGHGWHPTWK